MSSYDVCCLEPLTIRNPKWYDLVMTMDVLYYNGVRYDISPLDRSEIYSGTSLFHYFQLKYIKDPSPDIQDKSYFLDSETGHVEPFFVQVPCGHCDACKSIKINGLCQRASFACEESLTNPLFITLTYNDSHLPLDGLVSLPDVQKFKKRLNKLCYDRYGVRLKYFLFSEYGAGGRPHYHVIVYNFPDFADVLGVRNEMYKLSHFHYCWREPERVGKKYLSFVEYVDKNYDQYNATQDPGSKGYDSKSFGFVNLKELDSDKSVAYVSKYCSKHSSKNGLFKCISQNLGFEFAKKYFPYCYNSINRQFSYLSRFGDYKTVGLCGYYIKKLLPSSSKTFPVTVRRAVLNLCYSTTALCNNPTVSRHIKHEASRVYTQVLDALPFYQPRLFDTSNLITNVYEKSERSFMEFKNDSLSIVDRSLDIINAYLADPIDLAPDVPIDLYYCALQHSSKRYAALKAASFRQRRSSLISKSYI